MDLLKKTIIWAVALPFILIGFTLLLSTLCVMLVAIAF